jgi:predicted transposase YbfD/YdcC
MTLRDGINADTLTGFQFLGGLSAMPDQTPPLGLMHHFANLNDPRRDHGKQHLLIDIIVIAICSVICGADDLTGMQEFGLAKQDWLKSFLDLPNGIPSHDTFGRVLSLLDPKQFQQSFLNWILAVAQLTAGEVVAIDGKRLRRSHNRATPRQAIELVSAWARTNRLTLGEVKVASDSNEFTAVPELLRVLAIKGCIVTVDALNTQKEIARHIRHQQADYVMALKGNHAALRDAVENLFTAVDEGRTWNLATSEKRSVDGEHGRIETRRYVSVAALDWLPEKQQWSDLHSVGMVEATREVADKATLQKRYYLSSLPVDAGKLEEAVRGHWSIENSLHWVLDVVFREDDSRVRAGHAAENFGLLRKIAHSLLQQEKTAKVGVHNKRLKAALDQNYLLNVLNTQKSQDL